MSSMYKHILRERREYLVDNIDIEHGLVTILFARQVITKRQKEDVEKVHLA